MISYTGHLIRALPGTLMTIFKLSLAACAALIVGAWAEGAKANDDNISNGRVTPVTLVSETIR
jgi:hypothetical protein